MSRIRRRRCTASLCLALFLAAGSYALAQGFQGTIRGHVEDPVGALVPDATVVVTNDQTGETRTQTTSSVGTFEFPNLLASNYTVAIEQTGFKKYIRTDVQVKTNQVVEVDVKLEIGEVTETVSVIGGADLVNTSSAQLQGYTTRDVVDLPNASLTGDPTNLAILAPGTTTQPGGVVGQGGSIGGNRPRMNNFVVDGVDNNDPSVTGALAPVIGEAVEEFTLLTNQFTAEYGHSAAGQFITTTKSGTNDLHGRAWWYSQNRNLNSLDNLTRAVTAPGDPKPRFDWNRFGAQTGGPVIKDKWFYFGSIEYQNLSLAGTPSGAILVPTSQGMTALESLAADPRSGVSPVNVGILKSLVPTASSAVTSTDVLNEGTGILVPIQLGQFSATTPNYDRRHLFVISSDYQTDKHRLSARFHYSRQRVIDPGDLPVEAFNSSVYINTRRATVSDVFTFSPTLVNEARVGYNRNAQGFPVNLPPAPKGTDIFGNYTINDQNLNIGPDSNYPQGGADNIYLASDTLTVIRGAHTFRTGFELRDYISGSFFLPRARGEYAYERLDNFVRDLFPTVVSIRGAGNGFFAQNRAAFYTFFQDSWKVTPRLTLELGLRYEYTQVARDSALQDLNGLSSAVSLKDEVYTQELLDVLGLPASMRGQNIFNSLPTWHQEALMRHVGNTVLFRKPHADRDNLSPRLGFAWDVFGTGATSVRAGISVAQDVFFGNLALLQLPPQLQGENRETNACLLSPRPGWCSLVGAGTTPLDADIRFATTGFLEGGGLLPILPTETQTDRLTARLATGGYLADEMVPETYNWSLSVQQQLLKHYLVELRYLGNHAVHLPIQRWLSAGVPNPYRLPVFIKASDALQTNFAGKPTLANFLASRDLLLAPYGFGGVITQFTQDGQSWYHGGSAMVERRFHQGLAFNSNYTFSRTIDVSENELFTSLMNPRRPYDHLNPFDGKGLSGLHRQHKFTLTWLYQLPTPAVSAAFARKLLGGWQVSGTYIAESGQPVTVISRRDLNGDLDTAGDRAVYNPNGVKNRGSDVNVVLWDGAKASIATTGSASQVVGYVAQDPSAMYIRGGVGAITNLGRGTAMSPGINTWNLTFFKKTPFWGEDRYVEFRCEMWNPFNHPSYIIGNGSVIATTDSATGFPGYVTPGTSQFLDKTIFSGGLGQAPFQRVVQFGLKVIF